MNTHKKKALGLLASLTLIAGSLGVGHVAPAHARVSTVSTAALAPADPPPAVAIAHALTLALDVSAFPAGGVVLHKHVDTTSDALTADNFFGDNSDTQGTTYDELGFSASLIEKVRLPFFDNQSRQAWLVATIFPSPEAAHQAFLQDSSSSVCDASPVLNVSIEYLSCAFFSSDNSSSADYVIADTGNVEFAVVGFVGEATIPARDRAIRDATYVAQQEAGHVLHALALNFVTPPPAAPTATVAPPPPTATATPATGATATPGPRLVAAPAPTGAATPVPTAAPSGGASCPAVLHNAQWGAVSLSPDTYAGCTVDIAGRMYGTQVIAGGLSYDTQLNPDGGRDWTVFAHDTNANRPSIANGAWVRIQGRVQGAVAAADPATGAFAGNVPAVTVTQIGAITAAQARAMGADNG